MSPGHQPGQQRRQQQPRDARLAGCLLVQLVEEALLGVAGQPLAVRAAAPARTATRSGIGWRATSGLIEPSSVTPASTTSPGAANVQDADARARRPAAGVRQRLGPGRDARQLGDAAGDRQAELRARAEPDVRRDRLAHLDLETPPATERVAGSPRERGGALGLRPMRGDLVAGAGSDPAPTTRGDSMPTPKPPKRRAPEPGRIEHAEVQPRRGGDHELGHVSLADVAPHVVHRRALARPGGLVDELLQAVELGPDTRRRPATSAATRGSTLRRRRGGRGTGPSGCRVPVPPATTRARTRERGSSPRRARSRSRPPPATR